eukprot:s177_g16.t3
MDKMDGSRLPSRLQGVLSDMQAAIQSLPGRPANEAWTQAERQLQKSLRKLHRRCNKSVEHLGAVATDDDLADAEVEAELHEVVHAACETGKTAPAASICASARSDQHLTLFRKMNEWGFLSDAEKLERLKQAEQAARCPWWNLSQAELTEIVILAAACLAAPRRDAKPEGADAVPFSDVETATTAAESRDPNLDLQGRVWSLLLHALHVWRMSQFDCHAIEHVLDFVQQKSNKFEDKVGDIAGAAAGKAWLKIKQAVDQLMLPTEAPSVTLVQGSQLATEMPVEASHQLKPHRVRVRLERQSGIQNITWSVALEMRRLSRPRFKEAKAYREELVHQGKLKPPKPIAATPRSTVRGVFFDRSQQKWHVRLYHPVTRKQVYGGCFRAKEKAEAKARELAAQLGVQPDIEVLPVRKLSDLRCFEKLGPAKGVTWDVKAQCWHAQCYIKGKKLGVFIRPQDFSNQAVKQAWDEAVSWRRQQKTVPKPREERCQEAGSRSFSYFSLPGRLKLMEIAALGGLAYSWLTWDAWYLYQQVRDVPWVVARPVWLEEGERRAALVPNLDAFQASCIRYADLANWLLDQVDSDAYVGKMPRLQYGPVQPLGQKSLGAMLGVIACLG